MVRRTLGTPPAPRNAAPMPDEELRRMDNLEFNKAAAAVLVAGITFMVSGVIASIVVKPQALHQTVLKIDTGAEQGPAAAKEAPPPPIAPLLASADPAAGETIAKRQCASCHTFNEGGKNGVGPNLYGVIGRPHGGLPSFNYSAAIKSKEGPWTYEDLNAWLKKPAAYAPGTRMAYAGLNSDKQRADVIDYLRTLSANPAPLP
jgi:cytochrome c